MIPSDDGKTLVRGLLFSLFLFFAVCGVAAAQTKKSSEPAPSKPATPAAKPAPAAKPGGTTGARPNTTTGVKPGGTTGARPGTTTGAKPGVATGAKPGGATGAKPGTVTGAKTGGTTGGKPAGTTSNVKAPGTVNQPGGGKSVTNARGNTTNFNKNGARTSFETKNGTRANFGRNGSVSTIHTRSGMTINHGAHGERRFVSSRPGGGRIVGYGHGRGFAEHGYYRGGRPYMRRSYYYGGRSYAYAYRGYYWHGNPYYGYVPPYYYAPGFYGWAYNPWPAPVVFGWGWGAAPWYGYYGYYFAPAPVYPYPALWLTDYLLAANLQAAYEAQAAANAGANLSPTTDEQAFNGGGPIAPLAAELNPQIALWLTDYLLASTLPAAYGVQPGAWGDAGAAGLSPEVKQQIADEVKAQVAAEKEAAEHPEPAGAVSSTPPPGGQTGPEELPAALDPKHRLFIVSTVLSLSTDDGTECSLTPGDVITRIDDTPDANQSVKVLVASSQKEDCSSGSQVAVAVTDIQEMHNDFRAKIGEGLGKLGENQGKNGVPAGPAAGSKPNPAGHAQPDLTVQSELKAQQDEATQAEKEVQDASSNN